MNYYYKYIKYKTKCLEYNNNLKGGNLINYVNNIAVGTHDLCFVFIITSYNNNKWYKKNLDSIYNQSYDNWRIIYVDDASDDNTYELVEKYIKKHNLKDRVNLIKNDKNYKQGHSRYIAFKQCLDEEICCLLDGDDWLYDSYVLEKLFRMYVSNDILLTYGNFKTYDDNNSEVTFKPSKYPKKVIESNSYKYYNRWIATHLRTGYAKLFKSYPYEYLYDFNDELIGNATDYNEMMWVLSKSDGKHMPNNFTSMYYNKLASRAYENSYYNSDKNIKTKLYHVEIGYYLSLNELTRYEKYKTILIFTDLDRYNKKLQKFCDLLSFKYKLIFKKGLFDKSNDIKIKVDFVLFYDFKNITDNLLRKIRLHCTNISTNLKFKDLDVFKEDIIYFKLKNNKLSNNKIEIIKRDYTIFNKLYKYSLLLKHENKSTINQYIDKVYCINLVKNNKKLDNCLNLFNKHRIDCEIIRVNELDKVNYFNKILKLYEKEEIYQKKFFIKKNGELGLTISTILCLLDAYRNNLKNIIIFEDDILIHKNLEDEMFKLKDIILDKDYVYLGASQHSWHKLKIISNKNYYEYNKSNPSTGTFAIFLNKKMIEIALKEYLKMIYIVDNLNILIKEKLKIITIFPNLVISDVSESDIREKRNFESHLDRFKWDISLYDYLVEECDYNFKFNKKKDVINLNEILDKLEINRTNKVYYVLFTLMDYFSSK